MTSVHPQRDASRIALPTAIVILSLFAAAFSLSFDTNKFEQRYGHHSPAAWSGAALAR